MNNKILLAIIVLVVAVGTFAFFGNKKTSTPAETTKPTPAQTNSSPVRAVAANSILLFDTGFKPKELIVKAGTKITWINRSGKSATVDSDDHPTHKLFPFLNLGQFANGASVQVVFDKPGTYIYHNHFDASQTGRITVQ